MDTRIHGQIDELLAAEIHDQLNSNEQAALHAHLVECADCRQLHKEQKNMNKLLQENYDQEKADGAFEQRMLAGFRSRVPERTGFGRLLSNLMRLRGVQISAAAALLLALVQMGHMLTDEDLSPGRVVRRDHRVSTVEEPAPPAAPRVEAALASMQPGIAAAPAPNAPPALRDQLSKAGQLQAARRSERKQAPAQPPTPVEPEANTEAAADTRGGDTLQITTKREPDFTPAANSALANRK